MKKMRVFAIIILSAIVNGVNLFAFEEGKKETVMAVYDNKIPANIKFSEKYKGGHPEVLDYVFVRSRIASLRDFPFTTGKVLKTIPYDTKLKTMEKVEYYGNIWFKVKTDDNIVGYISSNLVGERVFRFQKALDKILELEKFISSEKKQNRELLSTNSYVPNPNNVNFKRAKDKYGNTLDQSTIGKTVKTNEIIYVPDRTILSVIEKNATTSRVKIPTIKEEIIIPNSSLSKNPQIKNDFKKVIAIDISNQNMIIFEKINNEWNIISYVYSKTGIESQLGFETPKGFFIVPMAKYIMPYNDGNGRNEGYARYATRFSGGGYLHGTPIGFEEDMNREFFMKQREKTLGTFTGTRKCIRTSEEHAKFIFDWIVKKPNIKDNEQHPSENVMFVIF